MVERRWIRQCNHALFISITHQQILLCVCVCVCVCGYCKMRQDKEMVLWCHCCLDAFLEIPSLYMHLFLFFLYKTFLHLFRFVFSVYKVGRMQVKEIGGGKLGEVIQYCCVAYCKSLSLQQFCMSMSSDVVMTLFHCR